MALVQAENGLTAAAGLPLSGKPQLDAQLAALTDPDSCIIDLDLQWEAIGPQVPLCICPSLQLQSASTTSMHFCVISSRYPAGCIG